VQFGKKPGRSDQQRKGNEVMLDPAHASRVVYLRSWVNERNGDVQQLQWLPMGIDKSGKWWVGTSPSDIKEYLEAYSSEGYPAQEFRQAKCACGGVTFELFADDN